MVAAICPAACRFALLSRLDAGAPVLTDYLEFAVSEVEGALDAFRRYQASVGGALPKRLALSVAAPVGGDSFVITQSGWRISQAELRSAFGFEEIIPVNDAAAVGLALGVMDLSDAVPLGGAGMPASPLPDGRYGLIHLDFGLGVSGLAVRGADLRVIDTEAGHLTFAPESELEERLATQLRRLHGRVSYERLLSWEALAHLHGLLAQEEGLSSQPLSSLEVVLKARAKDPLSVQALDCYARVLGQFAGDVSLAMGLDGGLFLGGRYIFEAIDHTDWIAFRERFEAKGRLTGFVRSLPTWAVANPASVLIGAARKLAGELGEPGRRGVAASPAVVRQPRDLAREVLQGAVCGLLVLDRDLRIVAGNDRFWQGASAPETTRGPGSPIAAAFGAMAKAGDWTPEAAAGALDHLQAGKPYSSERSAVGGALLRDDARPLADGRWVITSQDITRSARRAKELESLTGELREARNAADEANRTKSAFLATMSHEIRTPLNGVLGMVQAIAHDELAPVQRERLDIIRQSGEALLAILNDILDLSKIEAGQLTLEEVEFDLHGLVLGAHAAFTALANKKGLSFTLQVERGARGVYLGDPTRIRQILYNVLSNALKFTEAGEVRVSAGYGDGQLTLTVSDTGVGVPADRLGSLFERFVQADASTTRRYGGTGLGLAICRELAEMMKGSITAESELGRGTTVRFSAPIPRVRAVGRDEAARSATMEEAPAPGRASSMRVLAAEDNPVNRLVLMTLLHQLGIEPVCVEDGEQAVAAWEAGEWDVVLMDVQMPKMDGVEASRRIRALEHESGRARTPIIALTANVMSHQVQEYLAAGMDTHVSKPVQAKALFSAIFSQTQQAEAAKPSASLSAAG
jgi:glucokinase